MALGKLGAFLNKDLSTLAKDAGRALNTDVGTIAKGAGRVLTSDLGDLLRDKPVVEQAAVAVPEIPATNPLTPSPLKVPPPFNPDATQKMEGLMAAVGPSKQPDPAKSAATRPFDPEATQIMGSGTIPPTTDLPPGNSSVNKSTPAQSAEPTKFNQELLFRHQRVVPVGTDVKVLLPYCVNDFERPHATPSGELTNDPVNAVYSGRGDTILVQLALCWDADEAQEQVEEVITKIGQAARMTPERKWVIGPTSQGVVFAWTRDCYFFCATSSRGAPALARFLSAYEF